MNSRRIPKALQASFALTTLITASAYPQSLGSLLKTLQQATSSNTIDAIKSVADVFQGQLPAGASAQNAEGKVVLYRTSWCQYCKRAAVYMRRKNIAFVERDIEMPTYNTEYKSLGGNGSVPFIVLGDKATYGFSEASFDKNYADFQASLTRAPSHKDAQSNDGGALQAGQTMVGKIAGIKIYAQPSKSSQKVMALGKTDEVIYMGEERDGLYRVTTPQGEGWVDKLLVKNR